jgi:hypothetical protein
MPNGQSLPHRDFHAVGVISYRAVEGRPHSQQQVCSRARAASSVRWIACSPSGTRHDLGGLLQRSPGKIGEMKRFVDT